jgi:hypothetical protein
VLLREQLLKAAETKPTDCVSTYFDVRASWAPERTGSAVWTVGPLRDP